jgi:hypothetical protein
VRSLEEFLGKSRVNGIFAPGINDGKSEGWSFFYYRPERQGRRKNLVLPDGKGVLPLQVRTRVQAFRMK